MKICPFISHMLGNDKTSILEFDSPRDDESQATRSGGKKSGQRSEGKGESPLFCLKESCRFYHNKEDACQFDAIFETVQGQKSDKPAVTQELDKFWKFQVKSAAEMISSFGDVEKSQQQALDQLAKQIDDRLSSIKVDDPDLGPVEKAISDLRDRVAEREEGIETLSASVSEAVINMEDGLNSVRERWEALSKRIDAIETSLGRIEGIASNVHRIEAHIDKGHNNDKAMATVLDKIDGIVMHINRIEERIERDDDRGRLDEQFSTFLESNKKLEGLMAEWQGKFESNIDDIREQQKTWAARIEDLSKTQTQVVELIRGGSNREPEPNRGDKRREAMKFNNLGVTSFHNGDLELARDYFLQAVKLDDAFAECFNNLGLVFTELGEEDPATEAFSKAIELNPELHAAYNNLGYVFYRQGSYDRAIEMYNEALGRNANNSSAYTNLGNAYYKQGNQDEAKKAWEKAVELDPTNQAASQSLRQLVEA